MSYLGNAYHTNIDAGWSCAIAGAKQAIKKTAETLNQDTYNQHKRH